MRTIKTVVKEDIKEVLNNPAEFVDITFDKVLVEIHDDDGIWMIMLGQSGYSGEYYLVVEDDEVSEDYYPIDYDMTLEELYNKLLERNDEED